MINLAMIIDPGSAKLFDQVTQGGFAHHREQHIADGAVRVFERGLGEPKQQGLLALDPPDVRQVSRLNALLGSNLHFANDPNEQIDQIVSHLPAALPAKGGQQGVLDGIGVAAQLARWLGGGALSIFTDQLGR